MMKVIFLDIDGVLNSITNAIVHEEKAYLSSTIDQTALMLVKWCCELTGAKLVISSTWRFQGIDKIEGIFEAKGWDFIRIYDRTPNLSNESRGKEISQWIYECDSYIESFAIIDDDSDMLYWQLSNFVQTDPLLGFTLYDAIDVVDILGCKENRQEGFNEIKSLQIRGKRNDR